MRTGPLNQRVKQLVSSLSCDCKSPLEACSSPRAPRIQGVDSPTLFSPTVLGRTTNHLHFREAWLAWDMGTTPLMNPNEANDVVLPANSPENKRIKTMEPRQFRQFPQILRSPMAIGDLRKKANKTANPKVGGTGFLFFG